MRERPGIAAAPIEAIGSSASPGRRPGYYSRPEAEAVDALTLRRAILPAAVGEVRPLRRALEPKGVS